MAKDTLSSYTFDNSFFYMTKTMYNVQKVLRLCTPPPFKVIWQLPHHWSWFSELCDSCCHFL